MPTPEPPDYAHVTCRHKHYRLTCQQFDTLLAEADNRCQVCRIPASEAAKQMLYIDHDGWLGDWAVRGVLCNTCNTVLGKDEDQPRDETFAHYLENAWYLRMLSALGVSPDLPAEPPIGAVLHMGLRRPRMWRSPRGWVKAAVPWPGPPHTWRQLYRSAGPHNLKVVGHHPPRRNGKW